MHDNNVNGKIKRSDKCDDSNISDVRRALCNSGATGRHVTKPATSNFYRRMRDIRRYARRRAAHSTTAHLCDGPSDERARPGRWQETRLQRMCAGGAAGRRPVQKHLSPR